MNESINQIDILQDFELADGNIIVDNGNSSRLLSDEEIESLGYKLCVTPECEGVDYIAHS
jgi:hypothetical protein